MSTALQDPTPRRRGRDASRRGARQAAQPAREDLVFKALADARRREMLDVLRIRARTTGELCEHFAHLDRCTVMQHIAVLERADLVISRREGRHRWNHLNVAPIKELQDRWISPYAVSAVELLARLKRDLEGRGA